MKKLFISIIILFIIVILILNPTEYMNVALDGILVWATCVLPSIFPFMFFSKLFSEYGNLEKTFSIFQPVSKNLYHTPGCSMYVFALSIISGYPIGAKLTEDLYKSKKLSREEAIRTVSFCSNSGPMFIIGTVAVGMFMSAKAGYIILISHIISAILNGLIYRNYKLKTNSFYQKEYFISERNDDSISKSMTSSVMSILVVGGYICIFFIIAKMFTNTFLFKYISSSISTVFGVEQNVISGVLNGFFEITNGCITLSKSSVSLTTKTLLSNAIITFGGLSISFQSLNFLKTFNCPTSYFFLQKTTQTIISLIICAFLCFIFI